MKFLKKYKFFIISIASMLIIAGIIIGVILSITNNSGKYGYYVALYSGDILYDSFWAEKGEKIELPDNLVKEGYIFDGWYYDKDVWRQKFDPDTPIEKSITLYAYWKKRPPLGDNVMGRVVGGLFASGGDYKAFPIGSEVTVIANVPEGKKFSHWIFEEDGALFYHNPHTFTVTKSFTFTAVFVEAVEHYNITVVGGYLDDIQDKTEGRYPVNSKVTLTAVIPQGKRFLHWEIGEERVNINPYTLTVNEDVTVTAVFENDFDQPSRSFNFEFDEQWGGYILWDYVYSNEVEIKLPAIYDNGINGELPVKGISEKAFQDCANLKRVFIPDSVVAIGDQAFINCAALSFVYIPNSVTQMGEDIFSGCDNDKLSVFCEHSEDDISWPPNWNSGISPVTWNCQGIDTAPDGMQYVKTSNSLATIIAYRGTQTDFVKVPQMDKGITVNAICNAAFWEHKRLKRIELPYSVVTIGNEAFSECLNLFSVILRAVTLPRLYEKSLPEKNDALKIYVPHDKINDYKSIPYWNNYAEAIYSLILIDSDDFAVTGEGMLLQYLGDSPTPCLPENVKEIDLYAFVGCDNITGIDVHENNQDFCSVDGVLYSKDKTQLIYYPSAKMDKSYSLAEGTTVVRMLAFLENKHIEEIDMKNVERAQSYAFSGCDNLKTFYFRNINPPVFEEGSIINNAVYFVPAESVDAYKEAIRKAIGEEVENMEIRSFY